jgi:hypothetical protein
MSSYTLDYQFKVLNGWNINLMFRKLQGSFLEKKVDYNHGLICSQSPSKLIRIRSVLGLIFQNKTGFSIPFVCGTGTGTEIIFTLFFRTRT